MPVSATTKARNRIAIRLSPLVVLLRRSTRIGKPPKRRQRNSLVSLVAYQSASGGAGSTKVGSDGQRELRFSLSSEPQLAKKLVETTHYSLSNEAPARPDRRHDERYVSLLRVGALVMRGRRELCLIRNISAGGMMIRPYSPIMPGTQLSVELKHGEAVQGTAQWSDRGLVGVAFDEQIDVLALLSAPGDGPRPRMPRIDLDCSALLRRDGDVFRVRVVNISQGGICVKTDADLSVDSNVVVSLTGLHAAAGVVKWRDDTCYGVGFNRVYPVNELMSFLKEQQRDGDARRAVA
jgi:hypothetical protein